MNHLKTYVLLAAMTALFGAVGYLIGGSSGMLIALGVAAAMNLFAYWNLFIIDPLSGRGADNLFSTHPNTRNRIAQLMQLAQQRFSGATRARANDRPQGRRGPWG